MAIMVMLVALVSVASAQEGGASHPPVNVQASVTDEQVTLTWQGNVSDFQVTGYRIERYEGHSSGWETLEPLWPLANEFPSDNPDILETSTPTCCPARPPNIASGR